MGGAWATNEVFNKNTEGKGRLGECRRTSEDNIKVHPKILLLCEVPQYSGSIKAGNSYC